MAGRATGRKGLLEPRYPHSLPFADGTTTTESRLSRMPETQSRTQQFHGRSPPGRDGWQVSTVARRTTNHDGSAVCAVTGETIPLTETHFYVTLRRETSSLARPDEYDHLVVVDGALGELDEWLESEE